MNSEISFMVLVAHTLQRYSEANIPTLIERTRENISKILHTFRDKANKVYKQKNLVVPPGMQYFLYYLFCLEASELFFQKKKLLGNSVLDFTNSTEYSRREFLRYDPQSFMLSIAPLIYNLRYYFGEDIVTGEEGEFTLPPTINPWDIDPLQEGKLLCLTRQTCTSWTKEQRYLC